MNQLRQGDEVCSRLISSNQTLGYRDLILRRATRAEVEADEIVRLIIEPGTDLLYESRDRARIILNDDHSTFLAGCPVQCTAVIPVRTMLAFIHEELSIQLVDQHDGLRKPRVMPYHCKLHLCIHQANSLPIPFVLNTVCT